MALKTDWKAGETGLTGAVNAAATAVNDHETQLATRLSEAGLNATIDAVVAAALADFEPATAVTPITDYVGDGESLDLTGVTAGDNTVIFQRAIDALNVLFAADGIPRKIYFPRGSKVKLVFTGNESNNSQRPYSLRWRSGVGIASDGAPGDVTFVAASNATPFMAAYTFGGIEHVYCDPHTIDGAAQTAATYYTGMKGWFIQDLNHARFQDVLIKNTWATGFGCDFLRDTKVTGRAIGCGRGIIEKGIDPFTTSGGSGFGIGTGKYQVEDFDLDVEAMNCGFHGVFTEWQTGQPYFPRGSRIRALVTGNYVGFRDCGSDGMVSDIIATDNVYAGVLLDQTFLSPKAGRNGIVRGIFDRNGSVSSGSNIVLGSMPDGNYYIGGAGSTARNSPRHGVLTNLNRALGPNITIDVEADGNTLDGIHISAHAATVKGLRLRGTARDNGGDGVVIECSTSRLDIRTLAAPLTDTTTQRYGVFLSNVAKAATKVVSYADCRGVTTQGWKADQTVQFDKDETIGGGVVATLDIQDTFTRADTTVIGITEVGSAVWQPAVAGSWRIASGRLLGNTGQSGTLFCTVDSGKVNHRINGVIAGIAGSPRARLVGRWTDANNQITFGYSNTNGTLTIGETKAGVSTALISGVYAVTTGQTLTLDINGSTVKGYVDGTLVLTATTTLLTGTGVGVRTLNSDATTSWESVTITPPV